MRFSVTRLAELVNTLTRKILSDYQETWSVATSQQHTGQVRFPAKSVDVKAPDWLILLLLYKPYFLTAFFKI